MSHHPIVHVEFSANDRRQSASFYENVFGWKMEHFDQMNYTTFNSGEGSVGGGLNPTSDESPAGTVMVYIHADDLAATLEKVKANGGTVLLENYEIPTVGWMAVSMDPSGNKISLMKPMPA